MLMNKSTERYWVIEGSFPDCGSSTGHFFLYEDGSWAGSVERAKHFKLRFFACLAVKRIQKATGAKYWISEHKVKVS
jgi:hypothetical protein